MYQERTDTRGLGIPVGKYTFAVADIPQKKKFKSGKSYYEFKLETVVDGEIFSHTENVPVWMSAPILRAIGAKEVETGVFEWDKQAVVGAEFDAEIQLEKNALDGKTYRRLINPVKVQPKSSPESVPF